jgi:hypothetical protein
LFFLLPFSLPHPLGPPNDTANAARLATAAAAAAAVNAFGVKKYCAFLSTIDCALRFSSRVADTLYSEYSTVHSEYSTVHSEYSTLSTVSSRSSPPLSKYAWIEPSSAPALKLLFRFLLPGLGPGLFFAVFFALLFFALFFAVLGFRPGFCFSFPLAV